MVLLAPLRFGGKPALAASHKTQIRYSSGSTFRPSPCTLAARTLWMQIALYQPDIAQNTGTILRLAACLGVAVQIIEPAGFPVSDRAFRRSGMDYLDHVTIGRHASWGAFNEWRHAERLRLVLFTTRA